jgi:hypothetical protein
MPLGQIGGDQKKVAAAKAPRPLLAKLTGPLTPVQIGHGAGLPPKHWQSTNSPPNENCRLEMPAWFEQ